jgi:hypothetical protein
VCNGRNATFVFFTDLKKALDIVDHRIVVSKLDHYGVKGEVLVLLVYIKHKFVKNMNMSI